MSDMLRRVAMMMRKSAPIFYATWNPSDKGGSVTLSNGNKTASVSSSASVRATKGVSSGKWYWEVTLSGTDYWFIGASNLTQSMGSYLEQPNSIGVQSNSYQWDAAGTSSGAGVFASGDVVGLALDMSANLKVYKNNTLVATLVNLPTGTLYPSFGALASPGPVVGTANFGATPFTYPVPSGYNAGVY